MLAFERALTLLDARRLEAAPVGFGDWQGKARLIPFSGPRTVVVFSSADEATAKRISRLHIRDSLHVTFYSRMSKDFLPSLGLHRSVKEITIQGDCDEATVSMASFQSFPALEVLKFCTNPPARITSDDLPVLPKLRTLQIPGPVDRLGLMHILQCKNLQVVSITGHVPPEDLLQLAAALPKLESFKAVLDYDVPDAILAELRTKRPDVEWSFR